MFDIYQEGDVVWAQDYHLMLLPAMLKKQHPKMKVQSGCSASSSAAVAHAVAQQQCPWEQYRTECVAGCHTSICWHRQHAVGLSVQVG